jgi:hypothetical protein
MFGDNPTIVPLMLGFAGAAGAGAGAAGAGGVFTISIVPLNLGAAAGFMLVLHPLQVVAPSGFCVPQLGQNTSGLL